MVSRLVTHTCGGNDHIVTRREGEKEREREKEAKETELSFKSVITKRMQYSLREGLIKICKA
jgi:hypothetical protein